MIFYNEISIAAWRLLWASQAQILFRMFLRSTRRQPDIRINVPRCKIATTILVANPDTVTLIPAPPNRHLSLAQIIAPVIDNRRCTTLFTAMIPNALHPVFDHRTGRRIVCIPNPDAEGSIDPVVGNAILTGNVFSIFEDSGIRSLVDRFEESGWILIVTDELFAKLASPAANSVG